MNGSTSNISNTANVFRLANHSLTGGNMRARKNPTTSPVTVTAFIILL